MIKNKGASDLYYLSARQQIGLFLQVDFFIVIFRQTFPLDQKGVVCYTIFHGNNKGGISVENTKTITTNRQAFHEYFVLESFEAGITLSGTEIKSIRQGGVNLKDAWCSIDDGEMIIKQMHISPYEKGNIFNKPPTRNRKLLLHKKEILRLFGLVKQQGVTLVPLSLYFKGSLVKVQLGVCKGKKLYDKRAEAAKRDAARDIDRAIKENNR